MNIKPIGDAPPITKELYIEIMMEQGADEVTANQMWWFANGYDASDVVEIGKDGKPVGNVPPEEEDETAVKWDKFKNDHNRPA